MTPLAPVEGTPAANPLLEAALRLYHSATTPQQERDAYLLARALGLPPSYGENDERRERWRRIWRSWGHE